jgi:hypothetical protein
MSRYFPGRNDRIDAMRRERKRKRDEAIVAAPTPERMKICIHCKLHPRISDFWPCCSKICYDANWKELERRDEVKAARREGIPVAEWRRRKMKEG